MKKQLFLLASLFCTVLNGMNCSKEFTHYPYKEPFTTSKTAPLQSLYAQTQYGYIIKNDGRSVACDSNSNTSLNVTVRNTQPKNRIFPCMTRHIQQEIQKQARAECDKRKANVISCLREMKTSIAHLGSYRKKLEQKLALNKNDQGKKLSAFERLVIKGEIEYINSWFTKPGMKEVEIIQNIPFLHQALAAYSQVENNSVVDTITQKAAQVSLKSRLDYQKRIQEQLLAQQQEFKVPPVLENVHHDNEQCIIMDNSFSLNPSTSKTTDIMPYVSNSKPFTQEESKRFDALMEHIKCEHPDNCDVYAQAVSHAIQQLTKEGFFERPLGGTVDEIMYGLERYFHHLQPTNPLEHPQEFMINTAKYASWWVINLVVGNGALAVEKTLLAASQLQELSNLDLSKMTRKEKIDFIARQSAEVTWAVVTDKALNKAIPGTKQFVKSQSLSPKSTAGPVVQGSTRFTESESVVAVTTDGVPIEVVSEKAPDTSALKNTAEKVKGSAKEIVKGINKNGIYNEAEYHTLKGNAVKSPRPIDGQHALDNSFPVNLGWLKSHRFSFASQVY